MACSIRSLSSSSVCGIVACYLKFPKGRSLNSRGVKSGDRRGNSVALPLRPIHIWLNVRSRKFLTLTCEMEPRLVGINLIFILKEIIWGSSKNLHDCISTLVISGTSSAPTFQHILHRSIDFELVSDSCYCYPCWWCIKLNPPTSLNFNIIHFPIKLQ